MFPRNISPIRKNKCCIFTSRLNNLTGKSVISTHKHSLYLGGLDNLLTLPQQQSLSKILNHSHEGRRNSHYIKTGKSVCHVFHCISTVLTVDDEESVKKKRAFIRLRTKPINLWQKSVRLYIHSGGKIESYFQQIPQCNLTKLKRIRPFAEVDTI